MTNTDSPLDEILDKYTKSQKVTDANGYTLNNVEVQFVYFSKSKSAIDAKKELKAYCHKQVIEVLERVDKEVDNTVVYLTKDLPSLLNVDHDLKIRKVHKDEIHKIIQEEVAKLRKTL